MFPAIHKTYCLILKLLAARELGCVRSPSSRVQCKERVEIALKPGGIVAEPVPQPVLVECALVPTHLPAEVAAPSGEKLVPRTAVEMDHGARVGRMNTGAEVPGPVVRQRLAEEHVRVNVVEHGAHGRGSSRAIAVGTQRAELVRGAVTHEPNEPQPAAACQVER